MTDVFADVASSLGISLGTVALSNIISAAVILAVCLIIIKIILRAVNSLLKHSTLDPTLFTFIKSALRVTLYVLTGIIVLGSLGMNTSSLVAMFSVIGLAASLATQNSLSNLAGGILLLATKPIAVGDYVEAAGQSGTVQEVGLIYTKINTVDNKRISIPNSTISAANIINYTTEGKRRVDLKFTASYDSPIETVKKALQEVVDNEPKVLRDMDIFIRVSDYQSSSIEYTLRVWCRTEDYWEVYFDIMEAVAEAYHKYGVEMCYDHLNVHMTQE